MNDKNKEDLFKGEKVLFQTRAIINKTYSYIGNFFSTLFIFSGVTIFINLLLIILLFSKLDLNNPIIYILIFLSILFPLVGIIFINSDLKNKKTKYFITSKRIIKIAGKGLFSQYPKFYEIKLENIAYITKYDDWLEIMPKGPNGELHYVGNETAYKPKPKKIKDISIMLCGDDGEKIKEEIKDYLINTIPMIKHQNLEYLYLTTRLNTEKNSNLNVR